MCDMSLSAKAKVLRALQENKITRVGSEKEVKVNVRVLAATNKDLQKEISKGNFREDLYHRLSVIIIKVPSLNERKDDSRRTGHSTKSIFKRCDQGTSESKLDRQHPRIEKCGGTTDYSGR